MTQTLSPEDSSKLESMITSLEDLEDSEPFRQPVDYKELGLEDYPLVVTKPMDIATVRSKLKAGQYAQVKEALQDLQLIWNNCRAYNATGSEIAKQADRMERHTLRLCSKLRLTRKDSIRLKFEEKAAFCDLVQQAPYEVLETCVERVQQKCPAAAETLDQDRVQIRVDWLDRGTFAELFDMLSAAVGTPTKKSRLE